MKYLVGLIITAIAFASPVFSQSGQRACGDRGAIVERLDTKYGEHAAGAGLSHANSMVEVFISKDTGTWTILVTMPSGQACLVAAGEYWDDAPKMLTHSGQPT